MRIAVVPRQLRRALLQVRQVRRLGGAEYLAGRQVAVDGVAADEIRDEIARRDPQLEQLAGAVPAKAGLQFVLLPALAGAQLAAIAARGAPAHAPALEHDDRVAALGQVQGRRQAGVAGPDHADVGGRGPGERRVRGQAPGGGQVPGRRMLIGGVMADMALPPRPRTAA